MLSNHLFLLSLGVLALVVAAVLGFVLYLAARNPHAQPQAGSRHARLRHDSLRSSFRAAVELIEANIASRDERYGVPWVLVLNEGEDAARLPVAQSGVASMLGGESTSAATAQGIAWEFFDRGIVIDLRGDYLGAPDEDDGTEKPWDEFLGLCRTYRPQRPFDSLVITVPAALLLDGSADAGLELTRRAKLAHRRLWLAQNRFAMRVAVYLVIVGGEHIDGFSTFARAVSEPLSASMLGWSSPFDLSTQYQSDWVDTAFSTVLKSVSDIGAELLALEAAAEHAAAILMLPARIDAMRERLRMYVDELMRPSAYHEPFLLRGIYLTGDRSESLERAAMLHTRERDETPEDEYGDDARADPGRRHDLLERLALQPAFLKDVFERKIFPERGLTRPSRTQQLRRPLMRRALRWGGILVLGGWGAGLVLASWQLRQRSVEWAAALDQLHRSEVFRDATLRSGAQLSPDWYRQTSLAILAINERFQPVTAAMIVMPGSWTLFDDLERRVGARFEQAFGEIAVDTIHRELAARISQLTGASLDPGTGNLGVGGECHAPAVSNPGAARPASLAVDDQPETIALQSYVLAVDQLEGALLALQRLRQAATSGSADLRLVIGYTLGVAPQGSVSRSLPYFYENGPQVDALFANDAPLIRTAVRCALDRGNARLEARLFTNNPSMAAEQTVDTLLASLPLTDAPAGAATDRFRQLVNAIQTESDLLASGTAGWMGPNGTGLGTGYDRLVAHVARNGLLGQDAADHLRTDTAAAFQAFRATFARDVDTPGGGLQWSEKQAQFSLSTDRMALKEALTNLLNQPFMAPPRDRVFPPMAIGTVLAWDAGQLDQVIALADRRKHYLADGLAHVSAGMQPVLATAVDRQFAATAEDQLVAAATVIAPLPDTDAAAFQAAQPRLQKIATLFEESAAASRADDLRATNSADALRHLRMVDDALTGSELYAVATSAPAPGANPDHALLATAFGVSDAASLSAYLGQQSARAQALGQQAAIYLSALAPTDAATPLARRWAAINRDLERYKLKNPNSALLALEQFVMALGSADTPADCVGKLSGQAPSTADNDYFAQIHQRLYMQLEMRCASERTRYGERAWNAFASLFNRELAGLSPFAGTTSTASASADPTQLARVLGRFEDTSRALGAQRVNGDIVVQGAGSAVQRFAARMDHADAFLTPLKPSDGQEAPGYDIAVEFRTEQQAEVDGNQIIEWSLQSGSQTVKSGDTPHTVHWAYGTPISLTLRLAKDAPLSAATDVQQPEMRSDGHSVTYRFADAWSLITLMNRHLTTQSGAGANARGQTLAFEFPVNTHNAGGNGPPSGDRRARVFARIALFEAGKKNALIWPGILPTRAPDWTGSGGD
ncbi:type VI secretion system protein [Robbsia sp. Bb-Pol-6]|uniref:Type VI secretion system protein n=1 Tax=Robbsia betulipollinis TaxID=2981849 RepID=A0ABT3ZKB0_9BURK|nr:type VI secretion system protein [Robbsia betulipollinis]MCY0386968.1 type VI secretion system protein [Robbsia betulipollinis]